MQAEVIAIGDEMTSGARLDTNSQWLSQQLADLGIRTTYHTTVADDLTANIRVFREAADRADVIIASGGLGPTADDLTRQVVADVLGVELVMQQAALDHIKQLFSRRQRPMPDRNVIQAMFPRGSQIIPNPHGTAPGIDVELPRAERPAARLFCLPGVPAEMKEMYAVSVAPAIMTLLGSEAKPIFHRVIRCFGVGESDLEAMLPDLIQRGRDPLVGITVSQATISLRLSTAAPTPEEASRKFDATVATIRECLGNLVFGEGEEELPDAIARQLLHLRQTLATVECGPGGMVAHWLSEATEGTSVYAGGTVVRHGVSSDSDTLRALAQSARAQFQSDLALAIGPFPNALQPDGNPGAVEFALASERGVFSRSAVYAGHPDLVKQLAAKRALNWLRLHLLGE